MPEHSRHSLSTARRPLVASLTLLLLVVPLFAALDHPVHESDHASPIHTEAVHPDAAPHFDREEHHPFEDCLVCVHGARLFVGALDTDWQRAGRRSLGFRASSDPLVSVATAPGRSRAPPA